MRTAMNDRGWTLVLAEINAGLAHVQVAALNHAPQPSLAIHHRDERGGFHE
jgi:hypothetical protein